jgi:hypothetical protein
MKTQLAVFAIAMSLAGCAIDQKVQPVAISTTGSREICVIKNPAVRDSFLERYETALGHKGLLVHEVSPGSPVSACPLTTTYTASWYWDVAMYMNYVNFKIYRDGNLVGEALYDSRRGGANMNKFIDADKKVMELTNQLFPG